MSPPSEPYQPPPNPYATDGTAIPPTLGKPLSRGPSQYVHPPTGLQYLYMFNFVFESPKWMHNLLFGTLCQFIPVIGPIVFLGHQYECIEQMHRRPHEIYPDFDFNNFVEYLKRGVWVFLVGLIIGLPFVFIIVAMSFVMPLAAVAVGEADDEVAATVIGVASVLFFLLLSLVVLVAPLVVMPMSLRAGLKQDLGAAFDFRFIRDFIRRVWADVLLGQVFLMITYPIMFGLGLVLCCVGIYPMMVLWMLAHMHLVFQVYELYLVRGGEEIPLASDAPPVRFEATGGPGE